MFRIIKRIDKFLLFILALTISGSAIGCKGFPESTFELANESRLPKWITLPPGLTRTDVSIEMSYYVKPWGSSATFILRDTKGASTDKGRWQAERLRASPPETSFARISSWLSILRSNHSKRRNRNHRT